MAIKMQSTPSISPVRINRQSLVVENTTASSVIHLITFSDLVTGSLQWILLPASRWTRKRNIGTSCYGGFRYVSTEAVTAVGAEGTTYDVLVRALAGNGTLRLDLRDSGTNIIDTRAMP